MLPFGTLKAQSVRGNKELVGKLIFAAVFLLSPPSFFLTTAGTLTRVDPLPYVCPEFSEAHAVPITDPAKQYI